MKPDKQKEIVRRGYDMLSHEYRGDDTPDDFQEYASWTASLSELLPAGSPVLDLGCGCGLPGTRVLADHFDVTGVDFSEVQIDRARKLVPDAHFLCEDISKLNFPDNSFAAIVSFYTVIHMPLEEHRPLYRNIAKWLWSSGCFMATVGSDDWSGTEEAYLGVPGGRMCWSHADKATNVRWIEEAGLHLHWTRFVPEGDSGHTLLLAQKPPLTK